MAETLWLAFKVEGIARPAGSKRSFVLYHKQTDLPYWRGKKNCKVCFGKSSVNRCQSCDARILVNTVDQSGHSEEWKKTVGDFARLAMFNAKVSMIDKDTEGESGLEPLRLIARFVKSRPKAHFGTGRNSDVRKEAAPEFPTDAPDLLKLTRAIEDAMQGIVYKNDSAIVSETITKSFGRADYVEIELWKVCDPRTSGSRSLFG